MSGFAGIDGGAEISAESFGEWRLSFKRPEGPAGSVVWSVHVELDGRPRARLSVSAQNLQEAQAMAALREKARRWIVDFESRP